MDGAAERGPALPPAPPAADERTASNDLNADDVHDNSNRAVASDVRKPQRVAATRREPERKPAKAASTQPRRRPPAQPQQPQRTEDDVVWEEINVASKTSGSRPDFEVGSNNAPILD